MSCVLMPTSYDQIWKKLTPVVWLLLLVLPFGGTWNCLISRVYMNSFRGGFTMNYIKRVQWLAYVLCSSCNSSDLYLLQLLAFDTFTVGSGFVMIITDRKLRMSILPCALGGAKMGTATPSKNRGGSVSMY
ncbi:unnamed protein product [Caenorhabditis brenneri]